MAINLKAPETEQLLRRIAEMTGDSLTQAAHKAFERRLEDLEAMKARKQRSLVDALGELAARARALPVLDPRDQKALSDSLWGDS